MISYNLSEELLQDFINISTGMFYPLEGFMNEKDYLKVINEMKLEDGSIWTLPITLDVDIDTYKKAQQASELYLSYNAEEVGHIKIEDCYEVDIKEEVRHVFGTDDLGHPGVKKELGRNTYRIGGKISLTNDKLLKNQLSPEETKNAFEKMGWKTIVGFQTRNPIHNAHEHLQRIGLEICDGLFINPLMGWKKPGDFSEEAILKAYEVMINNYYPKDRVYFKGLKTQMRYAGPREAIFHAIIRRNLGCTHFIIGRDHAGVGEYYGTYEAHDLALRIISENNIGIELLLLREPYYCKLCNQIVSDKTCRHQGEDIVKISGTRIRNMISHNKIPDEILMRRDIAEEIILLESNIFIKE